MRRRRKKVDCAFFFCIYFCCSALEGWGALNEVEEEEAVEWRRWQRSGMNRGKRRKENGATSLR